MCRRASPFGVGEGAWERDGVAVGCDLRAVLHRLTSPQPQVTLSTPTHTSFGRSRSERRNWKRLFDKEFDSPKEARKGDEPCEASKCGHGGSRRPATASQDADWCSGDGSKEQAIDRRSGYPELMDAKTSGRQPEVIVAACDDSRREERVLRFDESSGPGQPKSLGTEAMGRPILGTGPGKAKPTAVQSGNR
jgi:hypothetical protein